MNNEEFSLKVRQVLALADAVEVVSGGSVDSYTHRLDAFEMARTVSRLEPKCVYQARIWDIAGNQSFFCRAYGSTEAEAFEALSFKLRKIQMTGERDHRASHHCGD